MLVAIATGPADTYSAQGSIEDQIRRGLRYTEQWQKDWRIGVASILYRWAGLRELYFQQWLHAHPEQMQIFDDYPISKYN